MRVKRKLNAIIKRTLIPNGFIKLNRLSYIRLYHDVPQWIAFDIHRVYKRIAVHAVTNLFMGDSFYDRDIEYFYDEKMNLDECITKVERLLVQEIFPKMEEVSNSFTITTEMQDKVKYHRERYIKKYLEKFQTFPVTLEELIENIKKVYEEMDGEGEEEIKEGICLIASVYTEYLMKNYKFEEIIGLDDEWKSLALKVSCELIYIRPLNIAYAVYFTKHFEAFVYGRPRYYLGINGEWKFIASDYDHFLK